MASLAVSSRSAAEIPDGIRPKMQQGGLKDLGSGAAFSRTPHPLLMGVRARGLKARTIGGKDNPARDSPSRTGEPSHTGLQHGLQPSDQQMNFASQGCGVSGVGSRCHPSSVNYLQEFTHMLKAAGQRLALMPTHQEASG